MAGKHSDSKTLMRCGREAAFEPQGLSLSRLQYADTFILHVLLTDNFNQGNHTKYPQTPFKQQDKHYHKAEQQSADYIPSYVTNTSSDITEYSKSK